MTTCPNCGNTSYHPRICDPCETRTRRDLTAILNLALNAATADRPTPPGSRTRLKPSSRPPTGINLDTLEPWLTATIELAPGDPTSRTTILDTLTMWEIDIRNNRPLNRLGPATSHEKTRHDSLTNTIAFHHTHLEWTLQGPHDLDVTTYIDHIRRARKAMNRFADTPQETGFRVPCPTSHHDHECGQPLTITTHDLADDTPIQCANGHRWTARRLTYTATADHADIWIDLDAAAHHAGVHPKTITRWATSGHIRKQAGRYSWPDIQAHINDLSAS